MRAMILAAGLGTRLGVLTEKLPKPMLPVNGKPLIEYNIINLVKHGFTEIIINTHFLPEMIRDFVGDGSRYGATIKYSYEEELLGTAGGVKNVEMFFDEKEPFLVLYGDLLTNQDLTALLQQHIQKKASATLILHQRNNSNSLVKLEDTGIISGFVERPSDSEREKYPFPWVNSGIQILQRDILKELTTGEFADLPRDVYPNLCKNNTLYGLPLSGERVAIDSPKRYEAACRIAESWR